MKETVYLLFRKIPPHRTAPEGEWVPDGNHWLTEKPPFEVLPEGEYALLTGKRTKPDELPTGLKWEHDSIKVTERKQPKPKVEGL